jgi:O-antigen/teichoic acid export membrane protein
LRKALGNLTRSVAIYGAGDVAVSAISFLLLPIYIRHLTKEDYGALALLIGVEAVSKIAFRWGLDGAFMRFYHEPPDGNLPRLASTLLFFLAGASGCLMIAAWLGSEALSRHLFGSDVYLLPLRLVLINAFLLTFTFLPFHAMRMRQEAVAFSAFALARSTATLLLRLLLVVWADWRLLGIAVADLIVTSALIPLLWPWWRSLIRPAFSPATLRASLRFGLPRLPHGLAQQALDSGNKYLLSHYVSLSGLGVYQIGSTIGQSLKFFLSAFETGWAPFYYDTARRAGAPQVFSKVTTYGLAVLACLLAAITAVAPDLVLLLASESYENAAIVVPLIALGIAFQGVYLLSSIGLNLSKQTQYYPLAAFSAAAVGLGGGYVMMPLWGEVGAALAFALSYLTLMAVAGYYSRLHYPVPTEWARVFRVLAAGAAAVVGASSLPDLPPLVAVLARGTAAVVIFAGVLWASGFLRASERAFLSDLGTALRKGRRVRGISHTNVDEVQPDEGRGTPRD